MVLNAFPTGLIVLLNTIPIVVLGGLSAIPAGLIIVMNVILNGVIVLLGASHLPVRQSSLAIPTNPLPQPRSGWHQVIHKIYIDV